MQPNEVVVSPEFQTLKETLERASKIVTVIFVTTSNKKSQYFLISKLYLKNITAIIHLKSSMTSKEDRARNEAIFIEFRKSKSPYQFCRYILGKSKYSGILNLFIL